MEACVEILRHECITETDNDNRYWCSTKVNENLEHADGIGNWGYCSQSCPPLSMDFLRKIPSIQGHPWQSAIM